MTVFSEGLVWRATVLGALRAHWGRALLSILGIALGVALGVAVTLINNAAVGEFGQAVRSLSGQADLVLRGPKAGFSESLYPWLARQPAVAIASPGIEVDATLANANETLKIIGIDAFRAAGMQANLLPGALPEGLGLLEDHTVLLSQAAASRLHLKAGDQLMVQVGMSRQALKVIGILPLEGPRQALGVMDISNAQWLFQKLGRLDRIDIRLQPGQDVQVVRAALSRQLPAGLLLSAPEAAGERAGDLSRAYRVNLTVLSLVALFTGAFLVFATLAMAVLRRRAQLALLRVLGLTPRELVVLLLGEGLLIGLMGALLGLALGVGLAAAGLALLGGDLGGGYFEGIAPSLQLEPATLIIYFTLGLFVALLGALAPALEAARTEAAPALKGGDVERALGRLRGSLPGLFLIALGLLATQAPPVGGLPLFGYIAIALLLVGAVLLMPRLLAMLTQLLPLPATAWRQVAIAQLRGAPGQAAVAVAAIVVSFSLMVSMAIMVASFRDSVDAWLGQVLPADLYMRAAEQQGSAFFSPTDQQRIRQTPGVRAVRFLRVQELLLAPNRPAVALIARDLGPDPTRDLPLLSQAKNPAPPGIAPVWISEAMQDLYGYQPGQRIKLPISGRQQAFYVAGVWRDYARQWGAVVLDRRQYIALTGDRDVTDAALWLTPGARASQVSEALRARLPLGQQIEIRSPGEIRQISLGIFDRSFAITYLLEIVAVLIGLFGISNSVSAQVLARRGEFGMLRHLGMGRREIGAMLALEATLMSATGIAIGWLLGWGISLILIHVVNRQSFHWSMGLHVPWGPLAGLSLLLLLAAVATALFSARQAMRGDVIQAVREE
ncbi:ABC transporter permease [Thermithiobacillus plumbiphilus]|uniref:ABC transporter permease n=1 Tax=Thermithiobacillus plumbiphilus TaxID=1729899 RepID=A0ABU9D7H7_9PROT